MDGVGGNHFLSYLFLPICLVFSSILFFLKYLNKIYIYFGVNY